jgi:hypothetical protein
MSPPKGWSSALPKVKLTLFRIEDVEDEGQTFHHQVVLELGLTVEKNLI